MRRSDREVTDRAEILQVIDACDCCRVGFSVPEGAYILPMNFAFLAGPPDRFYFHGAQQGRKAGLIAEEPRVGFELDCAHALQAAPEACGYSFCYRSVVGSGRIRPVYEEAEKRRALAAIMAHYAPGRVFDFPAQQLARTAVFRLDVETLHCKEHRK